MWANSEHGCRGKDAPAAAHLSHNAMHAIILLGGTPGDKGELQLSLDLHVHLRIKEKQPKNLKVVEKVSLPAEIREVRSEAIRTFQSPNMSQLFNDPVTSWVSCALG